MKQSINQEAEAIETQRKALDLEHPTMEDLIGALQKYYLNLAERAHWRPQITTRGAGVLALVANSLSARSAPVRTLAVFERVVRHSYVLSGDRAEAGEAVPSMLRWLDDHLNDRNSLGGMDETVVTAVCATES
jgi:hypothetical protein